MGFKKNTLRRSVPRVCRLLLYVFTPVARLRGGVELVASDNVKLESSADGRIHSVVIVSVGAADVGEYTVRATTDCAQISSAASIIIQRV